MENEILTTEEVAKFLKMSPQTIWRWINQGKMPAFKLGGVWRVRKSDLDKMIDKKIRSTLNKYEDSSQTIHQLHKN